MKNGFDAALKQTLKWEGGEFTDDPDDRGGATKWGVIQERYDQYRKARGLPIQSVAKITTAEVNAIYLKYYWNVIQGESLPQIVDTVVFDAAVNHGPTRAAQWLQALVGAKQDGVIGPATLAAVNKLCSDIGLDAERKLATRFCDRREQFYEDIAHGNQHKFLGGWMNRLQDLRRLFGLKDTDGTK